jgi:hypothetical protein
VSHGTDPRVTDALEELDRFLAGNLAPALFADSLGVLMEAGPQTLAPALRAADPGRAGSALLRMREIAELELLPAAPLSAFLAAVAGLLGTDAPPPLAPPAAATPDPPAPRTAGAEPAAAEAPRQAEPSPPGSPPESPRLRCLLERWTAARGAGDPPPQELSAGLLVVAAAEASSAEVLEATLGRLQGAGIGPAVARDLIATLSESVSDWVLRDGEGIDVDGGLAAEAIRRVVRLAGDRARATARWREVLAAAVGHLVRGAWGRAATLLDIAEAAEREGAVDPRVADQARAAAHEPLDAGALLEAAQDPLRRAVLRRFASYLPAWSVDALLDELRYEEDKKRRRLDLGLLEVHGLAAREAVFDRLVAAGAGTDPDAGTWWYVRNLVSLLQRLPRAPGDDARRELEVVVPYSRLDVHPALHREVFALLGQLPRGLGAPLLIERLRDADRGAGAGAATLDPAEWNRSLSALASALARTGDPTARRALFEHGATAGPRSPEAAARWRELGRLDLSDDPELMDRMLAELRAHLPVKVLGVAVARGEPLVEHLVRALAGTRAPAVLETFGELAARFPDRPFGRAAAELAAAPAGGSAGAPSGARSTLARSAATPAAALAELSTLLQDLEASAATGRLTIRDSKGEERAVVELVTGAVAACRCGALVDEAAFHRLFEQPLAGRFELAAAAAPPADAGPGRGATALLREARRRRDELGYARALVPDDAAFAGGPNRPTAPSGETDADLMRRLWASLREGASPAACEEALGVGSLRVRRILAHWRVEGALRMAPKRAASTD